MSKIEQCQFGQNHPDCSTSGWEFTVTPNDDWTFLFHGEFRDAATGYYNYGYRFYNDTTGRWLSKDSIGYWAGPNLYAFVKNNGINYYDTFGLAEEATEADIKRCNDMLEEGKKNEKIKALLELFDSECPLDLDCICCAKDEKKRNEDHDPEGFYDPKTKETRMCAAKANDQKKFDRFLYEELSHALQDCGKIKVPKMRNKCEQCLCKEIQAKSGAPHSAPKSQEEVDVNAYKDEIVIEALQSCKIDCSNYIDDNRRVDPIVRGFAANAIMKCSDRS